MEVRVIDLDGSLCRQNAFLQRSQAQVHSAQSWGPLIRLACSFGRFRRFEQALSHEDGPTLTFYGSGDFHHVSLALVRRLRTPINLLVLDNHPDWMRGVPFLHCGTWLYRAARLPHVERIFHVGGDVDFDNYYQWMAPWRLLRSGKISVFPSRRRFHRSAWCRVPHEPLRSEGSPAVLDRRLEQILRPFHAELARRPLYISLDKDVMRQEEATVNWDSGHLSLADVGCILSAFLNAAGGRLAGMDVTGDWSPVQLRGWLRHLMHLTEHPRLQSDAAKATQTNETTNLALLRVVEDALRLVVSTGAI
jgi:hypothetical protein